MRLFIGTWVRYALKEQLIQLLEHYQQQHINLNWQPSQKLHLTWLFLGQTDARQIQMIDNQLQYIAHQTAPMMGECYQPCLLPGENNPKVLAYQLKIQPNLMQLHSRLQQTFETLQIANDSFIPHITMARQPQSDPTQQQSLKDSELDLQLPTAPFIIDHLALVSSQTTHEGSIYQTRAEYSLQR